MFKSYNRHMIIRLCQPKTLHSFSVCASSSFTPYKPNQKPEEQVVKTNKWKEYGTRIKNHFMKPKKSGWLFGGRSQAPLNFSYPNKKGIDDFEVYSDLDEITREVPGLVKEHFKKLGRETKDRIIVDNPDLLDTVIGPVHNQTSIEYHFKNDQELDRWRTGCDSDWGEGFTKCSLTRTEHNTALFSGHLDTRLIRDGKTERAGWASMKTIDTLAFNRKRYMRHWMHYSHLLIKCRGDGRSYKVMLHHPGHLDLMWFDSHSYPLHTHGGPYWQYEKIPFSRFFLTVGGRIQDLQHRLPTFAVSSVGIVLMDRVDGPFKLEIDYIGVINDRTHEEMFAYEKYSLPVYTVVGI